MLGRALVREVAERVVTTRDGSEITVQRFSVVPDRAMAPSIFDRIQAAPTQDAVQVLLLEASRRCQSASTRTRRKWHQAAVARIEDLQRQARVRAAGPLILQPGPQDRVLVLAR